MTLSYLPHFVAKTDSASNPIPRSFVLKSLQDFAGTLEEENLLCPVRALSQYLKATSDISPRPPNLFVSPKCRERPLSKNAISFFIREVIISAEAWRRDISSPPKAHSVRGVSTSLAFKKNWSMKKILDAATWRSNSVFASFYLKDVALVWKDCLSLGPFVSAGQIITQGPNENP